MHDQVLPVRYIDKEKLGNFWRSHDDFKDKLCVIKATTDESYVVSVPRDMTSDEIQSVYYDKEILDKMSEDADAY